MGNGEINFYMPGQYSLVVQRTQAKGRLKKYKENLRPKE